MFFYLLCHSVFSTCEEIRFPSQETEERVHKLEKEKHKKTGNVKRPELKSLSCKRAYKEREQI